MTDLNCPLCGLPVAVALAHAAPDLTDCPRCLAVCPVGNDYHAHLAEVQKVIPERTPEKTAIQKQWQQARKAGDPGGGLSEWNARWVGRAGRSGWQNLPRKWRSGKKIRLQQ